MARHLINIKGQRFGRAVVQKLLSTKGGSVWSCLCDCGVIFEGRGFDLRSGHTISCGCFKTECTTVMAKEVLSRLNVTHGHNPSSGSSPTYRTWRAMHTRCRYPTAVGYKNYGGRGIKVCEYWGDFSNFLKDMGERPSGTSIDRINPDGDYEPGNCRWATAKEQAANKRRTVI
jgi:hypothetical protein